MYSAYTQLNCIIKVCQNFVLSKFHGVFHRFVPLGLMDWLAKMGCENVMELDWWEENCVPGHDDITFVCTPSQHWSKRTALDDNKVTITVNTYIIRFDLLWHLFV